ncbi:alpha/beta fold hydrolase [Conexibacter sp. DBS9H8]|uniref:alpha/beta fold hydrolase n=1 Tax=Conexibacter sp. DBS9H8 TaxID=2937801 RepID=UPI00200BF37C|nr:alpha/beta hydrolase [Conexibacter sp. DBS9H8]
MEQAPAADGHPVTAAAPTAGRRRRSAAALGTALLGTGAGVGAGLTEFSHRRRLSRDPEYQRLSAPLRGRAVSAGSRDGTVIHVEVFGAERAPTLVLGPGWTETLCYFDSMTRELTELGWRVVAYDLRGQGRSAPAARGDWQLARYGEDLEAVLSHTCDGRRDVIVAGHSLGAMSIAAWARDHDVAARVAGAALMNTGLTGLIRATTVLPHVLPERIAEPLARWAFMGNPLPAPALSTALSRAAIRYVAFGPHASEAEIAFYERMLVGCPPRVRASAGLAMTEMNLLDAVTRITVPTLVMSGRLDRLTPPVHAERIAAGLPRLHRLIELPGIGHMGPLESPHEFVLALLDLAEAALGSDSARVLGSVGRRS